MEKKYFSKFILEKWHLCFVPSSKNNYRPLFFQGRFLLYLVLGVLVLKLALIPLTLYLPNNRFFADVTKSALFQETNQVRIAQGLKPLKDNIILDKAAQAKAQNMLQNGYFAHTSPSGLSPWYWFKRQKYSYQYAGENLAIGFLNSDEVTRAWVQSPEHRKNIVNSHYEDMGLAVVKGLFQGHETTLVVQLFGKQAAVPVQTTSSSKMLQSQKNIVNQKPLVKGTTTQPKMTTTTSQSKGTRQNISVQPVEKHPLPPATSIVKKTIAPQPNLETQPTIQPKATSFQLVNFLNQSYAKLTQNIVLAVLAFISLAVLLLIVIEIQEQAPDLIAKGGLSIVLLTSFLFLGEGIALKLIPHHLLIC